jgi:hypothetical protein
MTKIMILGMTLLLATGCNNAEPEKIKIEPTKPSAVYKVRIDLEKVIDKEKNESIEVVKNSIEVVKDIRLAPYTDYSADVFKNVKPDLKSTIAELTKEYEVFINDITRQFDEFVVEAVLVREENINEISSNLEDQMLLHKENCSKISKQNESSCNDIKKDNINLSNAILKIENDIVFIKKKIMVEHHNKLEEHSSEFRNKILKLKNS